MLFDPLLYHVFELPENMTVLTRKMVQALKLDTKRYLVIPEGVTAIDPHAFADTSLIDIELPSTLRSIGSYAFAGCESLAFIHVPVGVTAIGEGAFEESGLLQITLPPALEFVHPTAFGGLAPDKLDIFGVPGTLAEEIARKNGCGFLAHTARELSYEKTTDDPSETSWQKAYYAANGFADLPIPDDMPPVSDHLIIPEGVVSIGPETYSQDNYSAITFPSTLREIGESAFAHCDAIDCLVLPEGLESIGDYAFVNLMPKEVVLPASLRRIGENTFSSAFGWKKVVLPPLLEQIGDGAFGMTELFGQDLKRCFYAYANTYGSEWLCRSRIAHTLLAPDGSELGPADLNAYPPFPEDKPLPPLPSDLDPELDGLFDEWEGEYFEDEALLDDYIYGDWEDIDPSKSNSDPKGASSMSDHLTITLPEGTICVTEETIRAAIEPFCTDSSHMLDRPVTVIVPEGVTALEDRAFRNILKLREISLPSTLRTIGNAVFYESELSRIAIPEGVTSIGDVAFARSVYLHTVQLPQSLTHIGTQAFQQCVALAEIDLPRGLRTLGGFAFSHCSELRWLELPTDLSLISVSAFRKCPDLLLYLADGRRINADSFPSVRTETSISLPEGVNFIPYGAYSGHTSLESITIPEGVTDIDAKAFAECPNLREVVLPEGLIHIHEAAFANCPALCKINFPTSLQTIGAGAFEGCSALETAPLNEGLEWLAPYAFQYCTELREVVLPSTLRYRTEDVFNGCPRIPFHLDRTIEHIVECNNPDLEEDCDEDYDYDDDEYEENGPDANTVVIDLGTILPAGQTVITPELIKPFACYVPKDMQDHMPHLRMIIPEGVTEIAADAFRSVSKVIREVVLPESLRHIGESAFEGAQLHELKLPEGLQTMGKRAFAQAFSCFNLEIPASLAVIPEEAFANSWFRTLTLAEGVRIISSNAFAGCHRLNRVDLPASLDKIEADAFRGCSWLMDVRPPVDLRTPVGKAVIGDQTKERFALTVPSDKIAPTAFAGCERLMLCLPDGSLISGYAYGAQTEQE